jgi:hypothetical protein
MSGAPVERELSRVLATAQRVDQAGAPVAERGADAFLADDQTRPWPRRERGGRAGGNRIRHGTSLGDPGRPAAVEDGGPIEAERAEHPPQTGRPHALARIVEDDVRAVPDAQLPHGPREALGGRHRERERRLRVGQVGRSAKMAPGMWASAHLARPLSTAPVPTFTSTVASRIRRPSSPRWSASPVVVTSGSMMRLLRRHRAARRPHRGQRDDEQQSEDDDVAPAPEPHRPAFLLREEMRHEHPESGRAVLAQWGHRTQTRYRSGTTSTPWRSN